MLFTNALVLLASASFAVALPGGGGYGTTSSEDKGGYKPSSTYKPPPPPSYETTCSAVYETKTEVGSYTKTYASTQYITKPYTYYTTVTITKTYTKPYTHTGYITKVNVNLALLNPHSLLTIPVDRNWYQG